MATEQEVNFILEEANRLLNREVKLSDVKVCFFGPLIPIAWLVHSSPPCLYF